MQRRRFHDAGLRDAIAVQNIPEEIIATLKERANLEKIFSLDFTLSTKVFLSNAFIPNYIKYSLKFFIDVFPFVQEAKISFLSNSLAPLSSADNFLFLPLKKKESSFASA